MAAWNTRHIPDQHGRVAVVTGANSGLGLVTAAQLARHGAKVVLAVRDTAAGERARAGIRAAVTGADLEVRHLDLTSLASVHAFAEALTAEQPAIDLLVNNAGVLSLEPVHTTTTTTPTTQTVPTTGPNWPRPSSDSNSIAACAIPGRPFSASWPTPE